mgnify:CR=1 FL=1
MKKNKYGKEKFKNVRFEDMISPVAVCVNCSKVIKKYAKKVVLRQGILQTPTLKYNGKN